MKYIIKCMCDNNSTKVFSSLYNECNFVCIFFRNNKGSWEKNLYTWRIWHWNRFQKHDRWTRTICVIDDVVPTVLTSGENLLSKWNVGNILLICIYLFFKYLNYIFMIYTSNWYCYNYQKRCYKWCTSTFSQANSGN